ncbi:Peptide synthetase [Streptomyces venezuelae]|uniref:non-ribosomal peptide synthetase family protein n=1 Tax=Streptomyces gardneri TaxID=66892 RepID=UPI0006BD1E85|nr:amino acid adenylation domain-containing protein [Streptomyces gardneri]ALO10102.1 Peptide synthetase [Streptomyces venezuelae]QPK47134.1 amino acid adenylation domain-containing protein [Streptomyces gardneri]WRK38553.1 amino acid adenylation domain-containing protein [Streptomyces venezuelae]CUM39450.1 Peptide synthetase [Streptomyces venezuelae]
MSSTLDRLLHAQASKRPDHTAVAYDDETLTFRELQEGATVLAAHLRSLGAAADIRVGVHVEPSLELVIGAWGVVCSGAAYVPLSPEYPEERLRYMIEDSGARIVFTQERFRARVAELAPPGTTVVTLKDAVQHAWRTAGEEPPAYDEVRDHDLAYVIYTSGSTGRPKGVMIEHRSIVAQMRWMAAEHRLGPGHTVLQKTPMSFDAAQWEILAPAVGARVAVGPPGVHRDPEALIDTVRAHGATMLQGVPTLLQALVDTERLATCTSLRRVYSGGEILSRNLAAQLLAELPDTELINLYGPTECTINASSHTVDRAALTAEGAPAAIPIGRPAYDTTFHIRDGELCIGGIQVARGYLDRPELTADRFVTTDTGERLYRTGDLAHRNDDGTVQFAGRADNQIKLRGFRVELDEIALAVENHDWVKNAAVIVKDEPRTGFQNLVACVELSPKEAALMDQGNHGAHHQSKESKLQVKAQLSDAGTRDDADLAGRPAVALPGRTPTARMRRTVFARKTYRFYEGGEVTRADVLAALARRPEGIGSRAIGSLTVADLGELLRWFGQFTSEERLLPKYGYASPGALYATQLYVEARGIAGLDPGVYYYHPVRHRLYLTGELPAAGDPVLRLSFQGRRSAIEPVYRNNIQEVLEIETGHMVGLFEEILPGHGLDVRPTGAGGTFEVVPYDAEAPAEDPEVDVYVQSHAVGITDLPPAQYAYEHGALRPISASLVEKKHVIAINQAVYERASLGITVISRTRDTARAYIDLGRALQRLQLGDHGLGFMSSGYSSKSGHPLPAARRIDEILDEAGRPTGPSYFFVGGRVSEEQRLSEGMYEDTVHMKGPAEMIRDDLVHHLPDYMIPNRVVVLDRLPLSANGKVDAKALGELAVVNAGLHGRPHVRPRTRTESRLAEIWAAALKYDEVEAVSVLDDFFESGGNSLIAVALITRINREFGAGLPLQILFESPTIEKLAHRVDGAAATPASRLVRLHAAGAQSPVYCWPGLGGYTMNLRHLAEEIGIDRPFYGVQAYGINRGEEPYATIREMAAADVAAIRRRQPKGPYTLWGYSFGARVAFESAHLLEAAGEQVENLFLIAPGSPKVRSSETGGASYANPAFVTILYSVFAGEIDPTVTAKDRETFVALVADRLPALDPDLIARIVAIVEETFDFTYTFKELTERQVTCPVTLFKAEGDDYSFLEDAKGWSTRPPTVVELDADHYSLLRLPDLKELVKKIRYRLGE